MRKELAFAYPGFDTACAGPIALSSDLVFTVLVASRLPRRQFLISSLAGGWADAIATAWSGIAQQPLAIEVLPGPGDHGDVARSGQSMASANPAERDFGRLVAEQMMLADVAIVPCGLVPALAAEASYAPLGSALLDDPQLDAERILPVLRDASMRWAGEAVAVPYGSVQPALMLAGETDTDATQLPRTWDAFMTLATDLRQKNPEGSGPVVSEPLAGGAAAKMFLWRASGAAPAVWLFDRETLDPVLSDEVYIQTLQIMQDCAKHYGDRRMTAGEVWTAVAGGRLKMAIAWPGVTGDSPRVDSLGDTLVVPLPRGSSSAADPGRSMSQPAAVMADPDAPLGLISSRCRQTAAARRFLIWLSGGEGSEMIRSAAPAMTVLRTRASSGGAAIGTGGYEDYLVSQLSSLQLRPTLQLHKYDRYLAALDEQVLACLDGKRSAAEALRATSDAWRGITAEVGEKVQARAWRHAQGLRN